MRFVLVFLMVAGCGSDPEIIEDRLLFGFPILEPELMDDICIGVDHDPEVQDPGINEAICTSYDGQMFPHCYDEHRGSDYMLDDGFDAMDAAMYCA